MALGLTQPLTEMSTRTISGGERRPVRKADKITPSCVECLEIWEPEPVMRLLFLYVYATCY